MIHAKKKSEIVITTTDSTLIAKVAMSRWDYYYLLLVFCADRYDVSINFEIPTLLVVAWRQGVRVLLNAYS